MTRRLSLFLVMVGSLLLASCGTTSSSTPKHSSTSTSTPGLPSKSASGSQLFVSDGTFVVHRAGIYMVGGGLAEDPLLLSAGLPIRQGGQAALPAV
jgi:hypothetical protein